MAEADVIRGYAQALVAIAEAEGQPERVEDELFAFAKAIEANGALREALSDPGLPVDRKRATIDEVLGERASQAARNALGLVVEQGHGRDVARIVELVGEIGAERRNRVLAEVRTAIPLDPDRQQRLAEALNTSTGKQVELKNVVDPAVLGGAVVRLGAEVIDGTVRSRLDEAKDALRSR